MITLKADSRVLTTGAKLSYLANNYNSGVNTLIIINSNGFAVDDYLLLSNFGSEMAEIVQISAVNTATHTLTLTANIKFAHAESTQVVIVPYNQVKYYHTAASVFDSNENFLGTEDLQADSYYTIYQDTVQTTGFGWFCFYNSTTSKISLNSNAIPYSGFSGGNVKTIFNNFFSLLNNAELKLITNDDAFSWLNEGYAIAKNELNMTNPNYTTSEPYDISVVSGTKEYALPSTCGKVINIWNDDDDTKINWIDINNVEKWDDDSGNTIHYYIRGLYMGFSPTPTEAINVKIRYTQISSTLNSYYDTIDLPLNNYYILKDFMLFRACQKLKRSDASIFYKLFQEGLNRMKVTSNKLSNNRASWGIADSANV